MILTASSARAIPSVAWQRRFAVRAGQDDGVAVLVPYPESPDEPDHRARPQAGCDAGGRTTSASI